MGANDGAQILKERAWISMKVLLLKDVYKLGRAGDVKKVADGYGRNYLLPQGLAVLATSGMLKQADRIRESATAERARLNQELGAIAERITGLELTFPVKAGETGKLYGSVTTAMIADAIHEAVGAEIDRREVDTQPIKNLGVHSVAIRLTIDLMPEVKVVVHREDLPPESAYEVEEIPAAEAEPAEAFSELVEELEAAEALEAVEAEKESSPEGEEEAVAEPVSEADVEVDAELETEAEAEEAPAEQDEAEEEA